jgi:hypothetical protein
MLLIRQESEGVEMGFFEIIKEVDSNLWAIELNSVKW